MLKLILLDRDGVINKKIDGYVRNKNDWEETNGSLHAIAKLNKIYKVAICTNQRGIGLGVLKLSDLNSIHQNLTQRLAAYNGSIDAIYFCPHNIDDRCNCRKPQPGMLHRAMSEFSCAPDETCFIGDSITDTQAAIAAKCLPILVRTGNGISDEKAARDIGLKRTYDNLLKASIDLTKLH